MKAAHQGHFSFCQDASICLPHPVVMREACPLLSASEKPSGQSTMHALATTILKSAYTDLHGIAIGVGCRNIEAFARHEASSHRSNRKSYCQGEIQPKNVNLRYSPSSRRYQGASCCCEVNLFFRREMVPHLMGTSGRCLSFFTNPFTS